MNTDDDDSLDVLGSDVRLNLAQPIAEVFELDEGIPHQIHEADCDQENATFPEEDVSEVSV